MKKRTVKPKNWSDTEKRQLVKLAKKGIAAREISFALGRHTRSIRKMAQEMRLLLRKKARGSLK